MPPAIAVTVVAFVASAAAAAAAATVVVVVIVVIIVVVAIVIFVVIVIIIVIVLVAVVVVVVVIVVIVVVIVIVLVIVVIAIAVAAVVFAAAATAVVAIVAAAVAVAITTTATARLCRSRCWLVVVLLSAVCLRHRMPSCDCRRSRCQPLLPPIVVHRRHRQRCRCRRAATATTATISCPLAVPLSCPLILQSLCCTLVISSRRLVVALPLVALPSCHSLTAPSSCRLAPAGCCVASRHAALSSSCRASLSSFFPHSHAHTCKTIELGGSKLGVFLGGSLPPTFFL